MVMKPKQILTGILLSVFLPQLAFAAGDTNSGITNNLKHHVIPAQMEEGDKYVTVSLFSNENCSRDSNLKGGAVGLIIDIGIALVGGLLENQKDKLRATYAGSTTSVIKNSLKCIKVERKEKDSSSDGGEKTLMKLELLVDLSLIHI